MRTLRRRGEEWLSMTQSHLFFDQLFEWHTHQPIPPIPTLVSMERQLTTHSFLLILQTINFKNIEETRLRSWGRPTPTPPEYCYIEEISSAMNNTGHHLHYLHLVRTDQK